METIYRIDEAPNKDFCRRQNKSRAFSLTHALASLSISDFQAYQKFESIYLPMMYTKMWKHNTGAYEARKQQRAYSFLMNLVIGLFRVLVSNQNDPNVSIERNKSHANFSLSAFPTLAQCHRSIQELQHSYMDCQLCFFPHHTSHNITIFRRHHHFHVSSSSAARRQRQQPELLPLVYLYCRFTVAPTAAL
ncbi:hypothetical protein PsorP6_014458 [Peronosclerospora sorghi]|uniref:Uncharacterized protein n=1 Tax=Peronosclerospora sorghi TaxID=230839 RepID=A0ACC0VRR5_9STRA|nr:hypothetical protein PsorP6_014458 [Peronosclerospora sorghi]